MLPVLAGRSKDGSDEFGCGSSVCAPSQFLCINKTKYQCVSASSRCDGDYDWCAGTNAHAAAAAARVLRKQLWLRLATPGTVCGSERQERLTTHTGRRNVFGSRHSSDGSDESSCARHRSSDTNLPPNHVQRPSLGSSSSSSDSDDGSIMVVGTIVGIVLVIFATNRRCARPSPVLSPGSKTSAHRVARLQLLAWSRACRAAPWARRVVGCRANPSSKRGSGAVAYIWLCTWVLWLLWLCTTSWTWLCTCSLIMWQTGTPRMS